MPRDEVRQVTAQQRAGRRAEQCKRCELAGRLVAHAARLLQHAVGAGDVGRSLQNGREIRPEEI